MSPAVRVALALALFTAVGTLVGPRAEPPPAPSALGPEPLRRLACPAGSLVDRDVCLPVRSPQRVEPNHAAAPPRLPLRSDRDPRVPAYRLPIDAAALEPASLLVDGTRLDAVVLLGAAGAVRAPQLDGESTASVRLVQRTPESLLVVEHRRVEAGSERRYLSVLSGFRWVGALPAVGATLAPDTAIGTHDGAVRLAVRRLRRDAPSDGPLAPLLATDRSVDVDPRNVAPRR